VRFFAQTHDRPSDSTLRALLPLFSEEVRPLLSALIDEVNHLIRRVRRGARRNHEIISRAVQIHQETLRTLRPAAFCKTYSPHGEISISTASPAWQAAG
jgi:flagellar biosynthesis/type III secretory pathway chaperone